eukprot:5645653-Alexandrium_andersonii.AAC.1
MGGVGTGEGRSTGGWAGGLEGGTSDEWGGEGLERQGGFGQFREVVRGRKAGVGRSKGIRNVG